jgi:amylosucrase
MLKRKDQVQLVLDHARTHLLREARIDSLNPLWTPFAERLGLHLPALVDELAPLYGERDDFLPQLDAMLATAWQGWAARPDELRRLDAAREARPGWFGSERMLGAVCYVDLHCGNLQGVLKEIPYLKELGVTYLHLMPPFKCPEHHNDGGYAVSSYREVNPALGTIDDLRQVAAALRAEGISLVLDFIFNHTSDEHEWALAARAGRADRRDFYLIYPDRTLPDSYERSVREIFPDEHPGAFTQLADGRWVWTTFHSYQWDLNYANPAVFNAMAGEMLAIANLGAEVLRMDAVAFIWKEMGTACENLPQAHRLIRAFNALCRIAAPGLLFKSEAIVHPDEVVRYVSPQECQLSYNPLQMALLWNSLATRSAALLQQALAERSALPAHTAWVNYVRGHDDIGWTFADEDAARLGVKAADHRRFLNQFFVNRFPGSFARGVPFQDNPATGDCRISGTCASLCGLEQGDPLAVERILLLHGVTLSTPGIPLLYLGDEVGTLNDHGFARDPAKAADSRWVHRPARDATRYAQRHDTRTPAGRIHAGLRRMVAVRKSLPCFGDPGLNAFGTGNVHVLGYLRGVGAGAVLVLANFSDHAQRVEPAVLAGAAPLSLDHLDGQAVDLRLGLLLPPYGQVWLAFNLSGNPKALQ